MKRVPKSCHWTGLKSKLWPWPVNLKILEGPVCAAAVSVPWTWLFSNELLPGGKEQPHLVPSDCEASRCASGMGGSCARGKGVRKSKFLALLGGATFAPSLHKVQVLQTQKGVLTLGSSHRQQTPTHPFCGMDSAGFPSSPGLPGREVSSSIRKCISAQGYRRKWMSREMLGP